MAIQNRRGDFKDFDPYKMVPGEFAIITSGDPNSKDGTSVYHCFAPGVVKRLTSYEDLKEQVDSSVGEIIDERIEEALKDLEISGGGATEEQIEQIETNKQNIENLQQAVDNIKIPAKTSELNNDSGFITSAVNDLANYYLKTETYSRTELDNKLSAIPKFAIEVVSSLPASNISVTTVYLVPSGNEQDNLYTEYIYVNGKWEYLGKQSVDLTGYVQRTELSNYYTTERMDALLETIRNSIPTKISQLADDSTHRTVTDTEKQTWNNKANTATTLAGYGITDGATKEQFNQVQQEIVDLGNDKANKNAITLGKHTDGLIYIFIDGQPKGDGLEINADVIEGDVIGVLDEDNNILLSGNLPNGTYTLKWLNEDGTYSDVSSIVIGTIATHTITQNLTKVSSSNSVSSVQSGESFTTTFTANDGYELSTVTVTMGGVDITSSVVSGRTITIANVTGDVVITAVATEIVVEIINLLPIATNADGSVLVGANGEKGYKPDTRLSVNDGTERTGATGVECTGFIEVGYDDTLYLKNIVITENNTNATMCFYNASHTKVGTGSYTSAFIGTTNGEVISKKLSTIATVVENKDTIAYVRICADGITADSIITKNQPIE